MANPSSQPANGETSRLTPARWLLAIDTSSDRAGLALFDGEALHECAWPADRRQTTEVPPRIARLLGDAGLAAADLGGVAVAIGPGTFTGLRVGLSLAKGLAMAADLPIVGVPTLAATAWPWRRAGGSVVAVLPAGRGRLVWQRFGGETDAAGPVNGTPAELLAALEGSVDAVVGELPVPLRNALADAPVPVLAEPGLTSRIGPVARLGWEALVEGRADDLTTLEPIYVHGTPKATRPVRDTG
jgi:tRNA threonylcarbamoyladenosine biosynthesis protein TsaB